MPQFKDKSLEKSEKADLVSMKSEYPDKINFHKNCECRFERKNKRIRRKRL